MDAFVIRGGRPLFGTVRVGGAKNAALPLLFATMITRGVSRIHRVPDIRDVHAAFSILEGFGARVYCVKDGTYDIDTTHLTYTVADAARALAPILGKGARDV